MRTDQTDQRISRRRVLGLLGALAAALAGAAALGADRLNYLLTSVRASTMGAIEPLPSPPVVTRAGWGAAPPNHEAPNEYGFAASPAGGGWYTYQADLLNVYHTVVIHHSAYPPGSDETMLDVQQLHMERNGWADVGYHFGVDRDGLIYEGRTLAARGAHVGGHNYGAVGVVALGNFEFGPPSEAQLRALQTLVNRLASAYALTHLAAHREFNPETLCPGRYMLLFLDLLAAGAGVQRGVGG